MTNQKNVLDMQHKAVSSRLTDSEITNTSSAIKSRRVRNFKDEKSRKLKRQLRDDDYKLNNQYCNHFQPRKVEKLRITYMCYSKQYCSDIIRHYSTDTDTDPDWYSCEEEYLDPSNINHNIAVKNEGTKCKTFVKVVKDINTPTFNKNLLTEGVHPVCQMASSKYDESYFAEGETWQSSGMINKIHARRLQLAIDLVDVPLDACGCWGFDTQTLKKLWILSSFKTDILIQYLKVLKNIGKKTEWYYKKQIGVHYGELYRDLIYGMSKKVARKRFIEYVTGRLYMIMLKDTWIDKIQENNRKLVHTTEYCSGTINMFKTMGLWRSERLGRLSMAKFLELSEIHDGYTLYSKGKLWMKLFGRVPQRDLLKEVDKSLIVLIHDHKILPQLIKYIAKYNVNSEHCMVALIKSLILTKGTPLGSYINDLSINELHDKFINCVIPSIKNLVSFKKRSKEFYDNNMLDVMSKNWETLVNLGYSNRPIEKIKDYLASVLYDNVTNKELANECAKHSISQDNFEEFQNILLRYKINNDYDNIFKTSESIPYVEVSTDDKRYRMYRLDCEDLRGLFLGYYTGCCQSIDGVGSDCAYHGMTKPEGSFYVVEKDSKIIAQSWIWRNDCDVVFDNIEILDEKSKNSPIIAQLYLNCAKLIVGKLGVTTVKAGLGYNDLESIHNYFNGCKSTQQPSCYNDSSNQVMIYNTNDKNN